jgi:hypothetical protein
MWVLQLGMFGLDADYPVFPPLGWCPKFTNSVRYSCLCASIVNTPNILPDLEFIAQYTRLRWAKFLAASTKTKLYAMHAGIVGEQGVINSLFSRYYAWLSNVLSVPISFRPTLMEHDTVPRFVIYFWVPQLWRPAWWTDHICHSKLSNCSTCTMWYIGLSVATGGDGESPLIIWVLRTLYRTA